MASKPRNPQSSRRSIVVRAESSRSKSRNAQKKLAKLDKIQAVSRIGLGVALLILGAILVSGRPERLVDLSNYTFESEPVVVSGFSDTETQLEGIPTRIILPDLEIDLTVKQAKVVNGYWEVFPDVAGWGEGSGVPGKPGNQVIFAHAREGLFLPLRKVKEGMRVYVLSESVLDLSKLPFDIVETLQKGTGQETIRTSSWYSYEIVDIKEVFPNQTEVIAPTDDETLTLYTCSGFNDAKRLIVIAKRVYN